MRIPDRNVLFTGQGKCPEFDCPKEHSKKLDVLLCFLDGAERRLHLQSKVNAAGTEPIPQKIGAVTRK
jgi:hypothetical protein